MFDDRCTEGLKVAAYDYINLRRTDSFTYDLREFFRSDSFKEHVRRTRNGFSIQTPPIGDLPPIGVNANSSDDKFEAFNQRIESMKDEQFTEFHQMELIAKLVNPEALANWLECLKLRAEIYGEIRTSGELKPGDSVFVFVKWNVTNLNDPQPVIEEDLSYSPLELGERQLRLKKGVILSPDGITQELIVPKGFQGRLMLALDTTRGTWFDTLEVEEIIEKPKFKGIWKGKKKYLREFGAGNEYDLEFRIDEEPTEGQQFLLYEKSSFSNNEEYTIDRHATRKGNQLTWKDAEDNRGVLNLISEKQMVGNFFRPSDVALNEYTLRKESSEES
jgi:hypothetical protein